MELSIRDTRLQLAVLILGLVAAATLRSTILAVLVLAAGVSAILAVRRVAGC